MVPNETHQPPAGLYHFLHQLIDYAGLFPPATLPLDEAIQNYARYRQSPERWMLARFIIPASRLATLSQIAAARFTGEEPFCFSVLGRGGASSDFLEGVEADIQAIAAFRQRHGPAVRADMVEVRLPPDASLLAQADERLAQAGLRPFYEATVGASWEESIGTTIEAVAAQNQRGGRQAGFKLRCGGTEASAFPSPAQVAFAIAACRDAGIAMKATAGLHHPLRHFSEGVQTKMHGFINVFAAGILAHVHCLGEAVIQAILEEEEPAHFYFGEAGLAWQKLTATRAQINDVRSQAMMSYGSCSFDEPRDDLRALGWL